MRHVVAALALVALCPCCARQATSPRPVAQATPAYDAASAARVADAYRLGPFRQGLPASAVLAELGPAERLGPVERWEAIGDFFQSWEYPRRGLVFTMRGRTQAEQRIFDMRVTAPCALRDRHGMGVGSTRREVLRAYGRFVDPSEPAEPGTIVAGSVYGGVIFTTAGGLVSEIFVGQAAE